MNIRTHTAVYAALATMALLLIAAVGCCLFAAADHHGIAHPDLCTVAAVAAPLLLAAVLGVVGTSVERSAWAATPIAVSIPDPPPWR